MRLWEDIMRIISANFFIALSISVWRVYRSPAAVDSLTSEYNMQVPDAVLHREISICVDLKVTERA